MVVADGVRHSLPSREFEILACLARSPGRLFSRDQLLAAAWGSDFSGADRTVDVYVNRIRDPGSPKKSTATESSPSVASATAWRWGNEAEAPA